MLEVVVDDKPELELAVDAAHHRVLERDIWHTEH